MGEHTEPDITELDITVEELVPAGALLALRPLLSGQPAGIHEITTATGVCWSSC